MIVLVVVALVVVVEFIIVVFNNFDDRVVVDVNDDMNQLDGISIVLYGYIIVAFCVLLHI